MDEPSPTAIAVVAAIVAGVIAIVLVTLSSSGVFSRKAFDKAPPRDGSLGLFDVAIVLGLLIVCGIIAAALLAAALPRDEAERILRGEAELMLVGMLAQNLAYIPAYIYLFVRVSYAMPGGLRAFGFGLGSSPAVTARITLLGTLAIFVLTFGTADLAARIAMWIGEPAPRVAHQTLRVLLEATGPTAWGLIFTAVVLAPIFEEILFRGLLQTALRHSGLVTNRWLVIIITTAFFALMHFGAMSVPKEEPATQAKLTLASITTVNADPTDTATEPAADAPPDAPTQIQAPEGQRSLAWQGLPGLIVLSLGLGYLYERTGSLWPPILVHLLFNASQITIVLTLLRG
ncbi:MAG: type II CAAX endopeptidase family protein [Phycisphaeraceae bacterium]